MARHWASLGGVEANGAAQRYSGEPTVVGGIVGHAENLEATSSCAKWGVDLYPDREVSRVYRTEEVGPAGGNRPRLPSAGRCTTGFSVGSAPGAPLAGTTPGAPLRIQSGPAIVEMSSFSIGPAQERRTGGRPTKWLKNSAAAVAASTPGTIS